MFLILYLFTAQSLSTSFLQTPSSEQLAGGISTLSSELSTFSTTLSTSLQDLDTSIDTSLSISAQVSAKLISGETQSLQIDLNSLKSNINEINSVLSQTTEYCQAFKSCNSCASCSNCGWCNSQAACVPGSKEGPNAGTCEDWLYGSCAFLQCEKYSKCLSCLATEKCGWCELGHKCTAVQGSCSNSFYLKDANVCPEGSRPVSPSTGLENAYLENELWTLQQNEAFLNGLIEDLDKDKEELMESAFKGQRVKVSGVAVTQELESLAATVGDLQESELKARQDYRNDVLQQERLKVNSELQKEADKNTEDILNTVQNQYGRVEKGVKSMESEIGGELEGIDNQLIILANALSTTAAKKNS